MRYPRLSDAPAAGSAPLVAVAHGSRDPRAAATVGALLSLVRSRASVRGLAGLDVRAAFLDHAAPSPRQALAAVAEQGNGACVVVPLLLTAAYHSKTDIPARIAAAASAAPRLDIRYADTLGPHPLLLTALDRRLAEAGTGGADVVLAAAGSSDAAANAAIAALAQRWRRRGRWRAVVPAYACAAAPTPAQAVRALRAAPGGGPVLVATYLLAPGHFADKIRRDALDAGAAGVSGALGAAPEVAEVILDRYQAAARAALQATARAQLC